MRTPGKRLLSMALTDLLPVVDRYEHRKGEVASLRAETIAAIDARTHSLPVPSDLGPQ